MSLLERPTSEASPELQRRLQEIDGRSWVELAGVWVGIVGWDAWFMGADGAWKRAPQPVGELQAALRASQVDLREGLPETMLDELLALFEHTTQAKVTRTAKDLEYLTEDQPGPEVIRSGQIGARGLSRWKAPCVERGALIFYANLPREDRTADFVCVRLELPSKELAVEVVDRGWFEIAAYLGP